MIEVLHSANLPRCCTGQNLVEGNYPIGKAGMLNRGAREAQQRMVVPAAFVTPPNADLIPVPKYCMAPATVALISRYKV